MRRQAVSASNPDRTTTATTGPEAVPRRGLLGGVGLGAMLGQVGALRDARAQAPVTAPPAAPASAAARPEDIATVRRAVEVRAAAARRAADLPVPAHADNGDENRYPNRIGSDTRGLAHDARGEVDPAAWRALSEAYKAGTPAAFEAVPLAGPRRFVNFVGPLGVSFRGNVPAQFSLPVPPTLASAERAGEAVELYWHAVLRDVPLTEFRDGTTNPEVLAACAELSALPDFRGPTAGGRVTPGTLFRATALYPDPANPRGRVVVPAGVLDGPMVSQFLLRDIPYGPQWIGAQIRTTTPDNEFLTTFEEWLRVANGASPRGRLGFDPTPRYLATGRDMAEYVRMNGPFHWGAALLLGSAGGGTDPRDAGLYPGAQPPVKASNPYVRSRNQMAGSATFGLVHVQALIAEGFCTAVRASDWHKYFVHRTLRPEAYGGLVHQRLAAGATDYPLHDAILRSEALGRSRAKHGSNLLSQCYPGGSPQHPSYPSAASCIGAVTATLLKAFFDEERVIPNPVQPDPRDPTRLVPHVGPPLTVGGELNKMAVNFGAGRLWAGIHWRADVAASLALGEEVAIAMLRDERAALREAFDGFTLTRFDGSRATI